MDSYHYYGMEDFDGGKDCWDKNGEGKLNLLEENARRAYDEVILEDDQVGTVQDAEEVDDFDLVEYEIPEGSDYDDGDF